MLVISDTSPVSNLLLINQLELLHQLFGVVIVPTAVDVEIRQLSDLGEDISAYESCVWIKIAHPSIQDFVLQLRSSLDEVESEAIALAKELHCDLLLMDERRGTQIARSNGLKTIGLLGVLSLAKSAGYLDRLQPVLDDLERKAGFWIGKRLRERFLRDHSE